MPRKQYQTERFMALLRQVEVLVANGRLTPEACREAGIGEQTYYSWRKGMAGCNRTRPNG